MLRVLAITAMALAWLPMSVSTPSALGAGQCTGSGNVAGQFVGVAIACSVPRQESTAHASDGKSPYIDYRWASICTDNPRVNPGDVDCAAARACLEPRQRVWQLWAQLPDSTWRPLRTTCSGGEPAAYVPPTVTPGHVLEALRRVGLPHLEAQVQPAERTLVNLETIFFTEPQTISLDLTILQQAVDVVATPTTYRWVFGDGQVATTTTPGAPYPSTEVTHRYLDADVTVQPHVEVSYTARFRVGAGAWQSIPEAVTTVGPPTSLEVTEATPLLSGNHR